MITLRHRALRRMLSEDGVGIALDDVSELAAALASADVVGLRERVAERRGRYTVEAPDRADLGALPRGRGAPTQRWATANAAVGPPRLGELGGSPGSAPSAARPCFTPRSVGRNASSSPERRAT